jgi:phosphatidylinositol glycan class Q protein
MANKTRQSVPLTFEAMFHQYFQTAHRIRKHYLSPQVLFCLLTGKFVPPIDRRDLYSLQYSMLPAKRASVWEMWRAVNAESPPKKAYPMPNIPSTARRNANGRSRPYF